MLSRHGTLAVVLGAMWALAGSGCDGGDGTTGTGGAGGTGGEGGAGAGGGGGTGGGGGSSGGLVSGPAHVISYAAGDEIGIDTRVPVSATFNASSELVGYVSDLNEFTMDEERPLLGTNMVSDAGHTDLVGWGRWSGGTMDGNFYGNTFSYLPDQGFHYVVAPGAGLPKDTSGTGEYVLIGATGTTLAAGGAAPGSATGSVQVAFGDPPSVAIHLEATVDGETYILETSGFPGGSNELPINDLTGTTFGGTLGTTGGGPCGGSCQSYVQGFFAADGSVIGIAYQVGLGTNRISGTAAFARQ